MGFIKRSWKGEEKLWKVFWIYGVVFGIILGILMSVAGAAMGSAGIALLVVWLVYYIWLAVAQWRCAFNADWQIWGYVVRILLVMGIIGFIVTIALGGVVGGLIYSETKSGMSECQKEVEAHVASGGTTPDEIMAQCVDRRLKAFSDQAQQQTTPPAQEPVAAPQTAPAAAEEPLVAPQSAVNPTEQYRAKCIQTMRDHAMKNNADADAYIAQNQSYIEECVKYHASQDAGTVKQ